jgi:uncharacterized protein YecT (DUF1311 family)
MFFAELANIANPVLSRGLLNKWLDFERKDCMMIRLITIALSILILFLSISFAADDHRVMKRLKTKSAQNNSTSDPCGGTSGREQSECARNKLDIADKKLNATYEALLIKLKDVHHPEADNFNKGLIAAQRAWIKYRDENCQFHGSYTGGAPSWQAYYHIQCLANMTDAREKELQEYLK